jgi:hypothetical protein
MPNVGGGSGQVVNPQQLIQMMRDAMQTSGGSGQGVTIENMNVYPNDGTGAVLYGAERAKAMAQ